MSLCSYRSFWPEFDMNTFQRVFSIFMLPILVTACAPSQQTASKASTASPASYEPSKKNQAPTTLSGKDKFATAIALDSTTNAVNPTASIKAGSESKPVAGQAALSIMGADISSLKKSEDKGGVYYDENGVQGDALKILKAHGLNYARIRVWVNSLDGYHGKTQLLEMARRLKAQNIKLLVDFHYADSWADPGKQPKPKAWENLSFNELRQALYNHTFDICNSLKEQGTPPDMVQVGNEITNGMLWPDGRNDKNFDNLAVLLKEGYRAAKDCSPDTLVMLHLDNGGNNVMYRWWFDNIVAQGVPFDLMGVSYYPYWHGTLTDLQNNLDDIALRYNKDIVVVETSYAFTPDNSDYYENIITTQETQGYPFTPEGQAKMLADIMTVVRKVPNGHGLGIMWWDATWTAVPGNGWDPANPSSGNEWENQALFDYENHALPAMDLFRMP